MTPGNQILAQPVQLLLRRTTPQRVEAEFIIIDRRGDPVSGVLITFQTDRTDIIPPIPVSTSQLGHARVNLMPGVEFIAQGSKESGVTETLTFTVSPEELTPSRSLVFMNTPPDLDFEFEFETETVLPRTVVEIRILTSDVEDHPIRVSFGATDGRVDFLQSTQKRMVWIAPSEFDIISTLILIGSDGFGGETKMEIGITTAFVPAPITPSPE